jgi:hypothetical protein
MSHLGYTHLDPPDFKSFCGAQHEPLGYMGSVFEFYLKLHHTSFLDRTARVSATESGLLREALLKLHSGLSEGATQERGATQ